VLFLREFVGNAIEGRRKELNRFSSVVLRLRSLDSTTDSLQFAFLTTDGYTYAASFKLTDEFSDIRIPLNKLQQTRTALRLTYPQMMDQFFVPKQDIAFSPMNIEKWEISTDGVTTPDSVSYEVENVWLE